VVRSAVLQVKTREFIEAAQVIGVPTRRLLLRHILPNVSGPIVVEGSLTIGYAVLLGAGLGFLGLGVQPPSPDWGSQVNEGRNFLLSAPWMALFPSLAISALVVGVNLLADGLTDG
jgi:ABC-type dipeptide/oligopeptide/nickel transport system permease subunit